MKRHHRARFSSVFSRIPIIISHHPLSTKRYFLVTVHEPCDLSPSQARFSSDVDPSRSFDLPRLDRIDDHIAKNKTARLGVQLSKPGSNTLTFTFSRGCNEEKGRKKRMSMELEYVRGRTTLERTFVRLSVAVTQPSTLLLLLLLIAHRWPVDQTCHARTWNRCLLEPG